ncbi:MAG: RsmE family RNA methyltransferase [Pirellulales bacterium]
MSERFFVEQPIRGTTARLVDSEAQHLTRVMRASVGDEVTLFDGEGAEFTAEIERIEKQGVSLKILERHEPNRELPFELTLAVALPKGDRQKVLMEKGTELGVTRLVPLITKRGVAQPVDSALERLARQSIEAAKQCRRNRLMVVESPENAGDFFVKADASQARWIAHPGGKLPMEAGPGECGRKAKSGLIAQPLGLKEIPGGEGRVRRGGWQKVSLESHLAD